MIFDIATLKDCFPSPSPSPSLPLSRGFNVVTLKDCTAATSEDGQKAAVEGTWGMFSTPMSKDEFIDAINK